MENGTFSYPVEDFLADTSLAPLDFRRILYPLGGWVGSGLLEDLEVRASEEALEGEADTFLAPLPLAAIDRRRRERCSSSSRSRWASTLANFLACKPHLESTEYEL